MTRAIHVGREVVGIPDLSQVVYLAGREQVVVAVPEWRAFVILPGGSLEAPDDRLLREHFPDLNPVRREQHIE